MATAVPLMSAPRPKPVEVIPAESFELTLTVYPRRSARILGLIALALVAAHVFCQFFLKLYLGYDSVRGLVPYTNLGLENNLPTWYSSMLLLVCAGLLAFIAGRTRAGGASYTGWAVLAGVFVFLSLDEATGLHERLNAPTRDYVGRVFNAWVIPAAFVLLLGAPAAYRFVIGLPRRTRTLVAAAGLLFLGGALGLEAAAGLIRTLYPYDPSFELTLLLMATAEEVLELLGLVLFAYALLEYLGRLPRPGPAAVRGLRAPTVELPPSA